MYKQTSDINSNDLVTYLFASNCSVQSFFEYCDIALGAGSTHQRSSSHKRDRSPTSLPSPSLLKSVSPHYRVPSAAGSAPSAPSAAHPPTTLPLPPPCPTRFRVSAGRIFSRSASLCVFLRFAPTTYPGTVAGTSLLVRFDAMRYRSAGIASSSASFDGVSTNVY